MTTATALLRLQELDLTCERLSKSLQDLPELRAIARGRAQLKTMRERLKRLTAERKDLEIDVEDAERDIVHTERRVTEAQEGSGDLTDYRAVQDLEQLLSDLAKKLDKLAHERDEKREELNATRAEESRAQDACARLERSILDTAASARKQGEEIQQEVLKARRERDHIAEGLPAETLDAYERARKEHRGLAVERLEGSVPSVCRMTLTESSLADLARGNTITTCPYCHRILIVGEGE